MKASTEIGTMNSPFIVKNKSRAGSNIDLPKTPFIKDGKKSKRKNFDKRTADGMVIYKIWSHWGGEYDVLALNQYGEWAYGRNYNRKTGRWAGATYRINIDDLYDRCPPYGKVVVDNHVGPTGRY